MVVFLGVRLEPFRVYSARRRNDGVRMEEDEEEKEQEEEDTVGEQVGEG